MRQITFRSGEFEITFKDRIIKVWTGSGWIEL